MTKRKRVFRSSLQDVGIKKHKGYTLPGYNYLGPGNDLNNGPPTSHEDFVAQDHDYDYQDLESRGVDPYFTFSEADNNAIANFRGGYGGNLGRIYFQVKRLASDAGFLDRDTHPKRHHFMLKRQSDPRFHFISQIAS
jgi:Phospholipase A2-like domain